MAALEQHPPEYHFEGEHSVNLMRELRAIDQENNALLRQIGESQREVEYYLRGLNKKIDLVANTLMTRLGSDQEGAPQPISLSEGGIAFFSQQPLDKNTHLALQLTLLPDYMSVYLYGRVVDSQPAKRGAKTSVHFLRLRDADRKILARHIMQVQIAERKQQKGEA